MISLFILFFLLVLAIYLTKGKQMVVYLPFILYVLDFGFIVMPTMSVITYIKLLLILISIALFIKDLLRFPIKSLYVFIVYILILLIFTNEAFASSKNTSKVILSMLFFAVGYVGNFRFSALIKSLLGVLLVSLLASVFGYIFGIGSSSFYGTDNETMGLVEGAGFYSSTIVMVLIAYLININYWKKSKQRNFWVLISGAIYVLILISLRRTAIVMPIIGLLAYFYLSGRIQSGIKYFLIVSLVLLMLFPLYQGPLLRRFKIRQEHGRFDENFYESEARYITTLWTIEEIFSFKDPVKSIFGRNVFAGGWKDGKVGRMYHSDHNQLLNTTGIVGTLLYLLIFYQIVIQTRKIKGVKYKNHKAVIYALLAMIAFVSLNGSLFITTFRTIIFLTLGWFLRELHGRNFKLRSKLTLGEKDFSQK